ncbi:hypothetical protein D9758_002252 [Tetrapyrgos nigripes]|uniref:Uncharacterized protein n=1 Tax=Tetrapyrgos nigripes TaxID=182062 RepID=A0A8H5GP25_9AGAR|nr:hypothetical protein D9758_002252 [Tetrapyrgos nigripes]
MSEKTAKVHTQVSNRAKPKQSTEKRAVFKPVLDNPLRIQWPSVPVNLQNLVLAQLISLLDGISQHHRVHRKRKREPKSGPEAQNKKRKTQNDEERGADQDASIRTEPPVTSDAGIAQGESSSSVQMDEAPSEMPEILRHLTTGINHVTKKLESQIKRVRISSSDTSSSPPPPSIRLVLVCRADVDPPILIDHLPHLVAACNSSKPTEQESVILAPLPKGAEFTLADVLGVRRAAVLGFDADTPGLSSLTSLLDSVPALSATWLTIPASTAKPPPSLIETHVKQLRTTAPKDMKAAKQHRIEGRAAAKERRKELKKQTSNASGKLKRIRLV